MQEGEMHTQMVGHTYAGLTAWLARVAAAMCTRERSIEVRLPELALDHIRTLAPYDQ